MCGWINTGVNARRRVILVGMVQILKFLLMIVSALSLSF